MTRTTRFQSQSLDLDTARHGKSWKRALIATAIGAMLMTGSALAQDIDPTTTVPDGSTSQTPQVEQSEVPAALPDAGVEPGAEAEPAGETETSMPVEGEQPAAMDVGQTAVEDAPAAVEQPAQAAAELPHDLTPWGMFMAADYVVKAVMMGLAFASLVTWTIWLGKALELAAANRRARRGLRLLEDSDNLDLATRELGRGRLKRGPVARLVHAAVRELSRSQDLSAEGVKERVAIALSRVEARAGRSMARGTGVLATIGSTAPFVGLFGTVWGIMNAFIGISQSNTTNLAVVAPGIAEALLATGIGLVAAIPAVIIYNVFSRAIMGYRALLSDASAEVLQHLSRDLDRGTGIAIPTSQAAE